MKRISVFLTLSIAFLALASPAQAQRARRPQQVDLVGKPAPSFTLHRLSFVNDKTTGELKGKVADETVSLAGFKDKQPVCLIFSSYT
ncbi:MAG: hypothetical protein HN742_22555 [Lentisphaerae bacterium]|jgi:hypothetical protein|nr:hypothetical protein [Lentisphaerota bacterium]MBT4818047.1 hypothetical protein [Lentisphaerota bacterium]MBT5605017.1 hypothetical protein [Lentisphaerota bacterium]MBT7054647.1 hypothetical protein [Lentisphaerota bacterium]MBT7844676.1 hypothetical protein [Lentisphaerota bacterium]